MLEQLQRCVRYDVTIAGSLIWLGIASVRVPVSGKRANNSIKHLSVSELGKNYLDVNVRYELQGLERYTCTPSAESTGISLARGARFSVSVRRCLRAGALARKPQRHSVS